jgi:hypothetical protein
VLFGPAVRFTIFVQKRVAPHSGCRVPSVESPVAFTSSNVTFPHGANTVYKRASGTCMQAENLNVFASNCRSISGVIGFLKSRNQVAVPCKASIDLHACGALKRSSRLQLSSCSNEECARYLETIKMYENKPADNIQERTDHDYLSRVSFLFLSSRSVEPSPVPACALVACAW